MIRLISFFALLFFSISTFASTSQEILDAIPEPTREYKHDIANLAQQGGSAGDYFKLKFAEMLLKQNNPEDALKWALRVNEPIFDFWKDVVTAEIHLSKTRLREVLALLRKLPAPPKYELSFGEGIYSNLYKRALTARLLANRGLSKHVSEDVAELITYFSNDDQVMKLLGDAVKTTILSNEQKVQRLHELHQRYQFKSVVGLLTPTDIKSAKISPQLKCRGFYELGDALRYSKGQGGPASDAFAEVLTARCSDEYYPRALYWLGSLSGGKSESAQGTQKKYLMQLFKNYPNHRLTDDAVYKLYKIAKAENNNSDSKKYFKLLMSLKKGDMKSELLFTEAFPLYKKQKYKEALKFLEMGLNTEPTADEAYPRLVYWYGRTLEKISEKNTPKAKQAYQKLVNTCPYSFYAILAAKRLGKTVKQPALPQLAGSPPPDSASWLVLIESFNHKGMHDAAKTVLDFALHENPSWENSHKEFVVRTLIESQNYRKALDIVAKHFDSGVYGPVTGSSDPLFAAFYPMPFKQKTKTGYARSDLPFGSIEGIMREESLFQRTVKSPVGATGLMQLMPTTASMLRGKMPDVNFEFGLTDPEENIILGSTYLSDMKDYFDEQMPLAIMAYNAGPGNVNKWLRQFGELELDEFIENIPFTETQGYVKRVMRSMQVYGLMYNESYFKKPDFFSMTIDRGSKK